MTTHALVGSSSDKQFMYFSGGVATNNERAMGIGDQMFRVCFCSFSKNIFFIHILHTCYLRNKPS